MIWKGKEVKTIGEILNAVTAIDTPEEAAAFMDVYRTENKFADENVGYLSGYLDTEGMRRVQQLFKVAHPIFGTTTPTPKEALEAGKQHAQQ